MQLYALIDTSPDMSVTVFDAFFSGMFVVREYGNHVRLSLKIPPDPKRTATLLCEIFRTFLTYSSK